MSLQPSCASSRPTEAGLEGAGPGDLHFTTPRGEHGAAGPAPSACPWVQLRKASFSSRKKDGHTGQGDSISKAREAKSLCKSLGAWIVGEASGKGGGRDVCGLIVKGHALSSSGLRPSL